jgi:flagellar biosynthesis chaperone FliJ
MVTHTVEQLEKNLGVSFGYVKKDLLSVNDMVSDMHEKIQHLSLNQAMLLEKVMKLEQKLSSKPVAKKIVKKVAKKKAAPKKARKAAAKPVKKIVKETTVYQ